VPKVNERAFGAVNLKNDRTAVGELSMTEQSDTLTLGTLNFTLQTFY
jgi:hypothetical protein